MYSITVGFSPALYCCINVTTMGNPFKCHKYVFYLQPMFGVLGPRCWTGSSMLDCHILKGFGIYMIGILGSLY